MTAPARIVLVGLMGAGKSVVARALAERAGGDVIDTDDRVAQRAEMTIPEIFDTEGEEAFRRRELEALRSALAEPGPGVIATGGGVVTSEPARALLRAHLPVVFLDVSIATALARVGDATTRPLLADDPAGRLTALSAERRSLYEEVADVVVDANGRSTSRVVDAVLRAVGEVS